MCSRVLQLALPILSKGEEKSFSAGVPKLESITTFDGVCNETSYLLEVDRWNQQVGLTIWFELKDNY